MLYISSVPGFVLTLGMQFAVESPRWLCKVRPRFSLYVHSVNVPGVSLICNICCLCRQGDLMMLNKLLAVFGDHLKSTKPLKNFSLSLEQMVVIWIADGWNSLRSHTLEVVLRWFLDFSCKYSLYFLMLYFLFLVDVATCQMLFSTQPLSKMLHMLPRYVSHY